MYSPQKDIGCTTEQGLPELLRQLWFHLSHRRRLQLGLVLTVMLASTIAEVLSLGAIGPFLAVLTSPQKLWGQPLIHNFATQFGIATPEALLTPITVIFALASIAAGTIRLSSLWLNGLFAADVGSDLSSDAYQRTLYQPYAVHLLLNSNELITTVSVDVQRVTAQVLNPLLLLISSGMVATGILAALLIINWIITVGIGLTLVLIYGVAIATSRQSLQHSSQSSVALNSQLIKLVQEGLGSIREVILGGMQDYFADTYCLVDHKLRQTLAQTNFLSTYPRLVLEPVGMALIAVMSLLLVYQQGVSAALPLLGAFALGAQRLLPSAQRIYEGWALSRNAKSSLANVLKLIAQPLPSNCVGDLNSTPLTLKKCIQFKNVSFSYSRDLPAVLKAINFEIHSGERVGLVGKTGCGKTTTIDLLMGLLHPTEGKIFIDGEDLHEPTSPKRVAAWQSGIAHVPQNIYLTDSSIAENIAFGVPKDQINMFKVQEAAERAQIASYITTAPDSYYSHVGERGIRLSGGQRQRIGIARALYKRSKILVLDEATSALDNHTEASVMESIDGLSRDLTVIMIAHRLSTIARCDIVIELDNGTVKSIRRQP